MEILPCGHRMVDPSGAFCATCKQASVNNDAAVELLREETRQGNNSYSDEALLEGFVLLANKEMGRREAGKWIAIFVSAASAIAAGANLVLSELDRRRSDRQRLNDWQTAISTIEQAAESNDKENKLRQLKSDYQQGGYFTAAWLCDAALEHLCLGQPLQAQARYRKVIDDSSTWHDLPREAKRHVLVRLGKVSNNIGDHGIAATMFQRVLDENLNNTGHDDLDITRESLNSWYQTFPSSAVLAGISSQFTYEPVTHMEQLLARAAQQLKVKDVREANEPFGGLKSGIAMFRDILDYLSTRETRYLESHMKLIEEMIEFKKTTGWNRYSQFIALALAGGDLDSSWKGLSAALSWLMGRPLNDEEVREHALALAKQKVKPAPQRDPGRIEIAVHLLLWAQYYWALFKLHGTASTIASSTLFFEGARELLAQSNHRRFIRDVDRFLADCPTDPVQLTTGVRGHVRSYGPPKYNTAVFLPLVPQSLSA